MVRLNPRLLGDCAIEWLDGRVTSSASHLFALTLLLTLDVQKPRTRRVLESLLFDEHAADDAAAHNLRQLLYRLRRYGLEVTDIGGVLALSDVAVDDPLTELAGMPMSAR